MADSGRARTSRSWSPKKTRSSVPGSPQDGTPYVHGANDSSVPDRGFGLTDYNRSKEYPMVGEKKESIPDLGFGLRCLSAGPRRTKTGPRVGEDDSTLPDLGFGLRRGGSERAPKTPRDGVEEVIVPKRAYTLGSEASPSKPVPHMSTKDCSKFLDDLKTSVEAVRQTANERRMSGNFPASKPGKDGNTSPKRFSNVLCNADDGNLTDNCSDDDFELEAGLKNVESKASDIKRAIDEMESQLPKLPKVNKFLKTVGVDTPRAERADSPVVEPTLQSEIYDCLVQTIDALQSMVSAVLEEGRRMELNAVFVRAKELTSSGGGEVNPNLADALVAELNAHAARVDHQTKLALETKEALEAVVSALSQILVGMSNEQKKGMHEILAEAKADHQKLVNLERQLENTRAELQKAIDAVNKTPKTRKVSVGKSGADLEKEVQSLKKLLDGKEASIKELQKELKSLKDQQASRPADTKQSTPTAGVSKISGLSAKGVVLTPKTAGSTSSSGAKLTQKKSAPAGPIGVAKAKPAVSSVSASTSPTKGSVRLSDLAPAKMGAK